MQPVSAALLARVYLAICWDDITAFESQQVSWDQVCNWGLNPLPITLDHSGGG